MRDAEGQRLLLVREASAHLRVSNMTLYRLIKDGELPAIRVGKNYRIRESDLVDYLVARSSGCDCSCHQVVQPGLVPCPTCVHSSRYE